MTVVELRSPKRKFSLAKRPDLIFWSSQGSLEICWLSGIPAWDPSGTRLSAMCLVPGLAGLEAFREREI